MSIIETITVYTTSFKHESSVVTSSISFKSHGDFNVRDVVVETSMGVSKQLLLMYGHYSVYTNFPLTILRTMEFSFNFRWRLNS
jgi:hypothetical protein